MSNKESWKKYNKINIKQKKRTKIPADTNKVQERKEKY